MDTRQLTTALTLFAAVSAAHADRVDASGRSVADKEFPAEDWLAGAAERGGLAVAKQGRHAPVDFIVSDDGASVAVQAKGLTRRGAAAVRTTLDYNSTLPTPQYQGMPELLLYAEMGSGSDGCVVETTVLADMGLVQQDCGVAESEPVKGAGSYGDMTMRLRLMYVGAQPAALLGEQGLDVSGRSVLVLRSGAVSTSAAAASGLARLGSVRRSFAARRPVSIQKFFDGRPAQVVYEAVEQREDLVFDVWGHASHPPLPQARRRSPSAEQLALVW